MGILIREACGEAWDLASYQPVMPSGAGGVLLPGKRTSWRAATDGLGPKGAVKLSRKEQVQAGPP